MVSQINKRVLAWFPRPVITPVVGALALVIGITGVMLFFHLGEGLVKGMHEWLGLLFAAVMLIHMLSNWNALINYFNKRVARVGMLLVLLVSGLFLGGSALSERPGQDVVFKAIGTAPVATLAQLFQVDETQLLLTLKGRGVVISEGSETLQASAEKSGRDNREIMQQLIASVVAVQHQE